MLTLRFLSALNALARNNIIINSYSKLLSLEGTFEQFNKSFDIHLNKNISFSADLSFALNAVSLPHSFGDYEPTYNIMVSSKVNVAAFHLFYIILRDLEDFDYNECNFYFLTYPYRARDGFQGKIAIGISQKQTDLLDIQKEDRTVTIIDKQVLENFFNNHTPEEIFQIGVYGIIKYNKEGGVGKLEHDYQSNVSFRNDEDDNLYTGSHEFEDYIPKYNEYNEDAFDGFIDGGWNTD